MTKRQKPITGAALRRLVLDSYFGEIGPRDLVLLEAAVAALDQALAAERLLRREGLVVKGARGPKPHPAIAIVKSARQRLLDALGALNLPIVF